MKKTLFNGVGVAMVTPFTESGVDYGETERLIEHIISGGSDALFVLGTTGEPATMTAAEREEFLQFVILTVKNRIPVIAGTGSNSTADAVAKSRRAEQLGADGLLVVTPYYNKCTQNGLVAHYQAVSDSVNIPIFAYNVPTRTRVNIEPDTAAKLAELKNVVALKEASGDIDQMLAVAAAIDGKMDWYSGDDSLTSVAMSLGAKGVISVAANVIPKEMKELTDLCAENRYPEAAKLQFKLAPFMKALFCEVNPIPAKKALEYIGIKAGIPRLPLTEMEQPHAEKLLEVMKELHIVGGKH